MGPLLLARMLELNDTQEGVLNIAFKLADDQGLLLLDFKDLTAILQAVAEGADQLTTSLRQCQQGHDRHHPAPPAHAGAAGGRAFLRRAGAGAVGPDADHAGRAGCRQRAGGRQADPVAAALRHLPALAAVGAVRGAARGRRPRQAQARLLLRRGAPAVQRRAQGADREGRAGGPADPLQGGRRLLRHPEPGRRAAGDPGPARQSGAARAARLHARRAEGDQGGGRDLPPQPGVQDPGRDHPAGRRRGAGLEPGARRRARHRRAGEGHPAALAHGHDHARGAPADHDGEPGGLQVRRDRGPGIGLRDPAESRQHGAGGGRAGESVGRGHGRGAGRHRQSVGRAPSQRRVVAPDRRRRPPAPAPRRRAPAPRAEPASTGGIGDVLGSILGGGGGRRQSAAEAMVKSAMRSVGSNVGRQVGNAIVRGVLGSILKR